MNIRVKGTSQNLESFYDKLHAMGIVLEYPVSIDRDSALIETLQAQNEVVTLDLTFTPITSRSTVSG